MGNSIESLNGDALYYPFKMVLNPKSGYPVIMYNDSATMNLKVAEYYGTSWDNVGEIPIKKIDNASIWSLYRLAVNPINGHYFIALFDPEDATNGGLTIFEYDGSQWKKVGDSPPNVKASGYTSSELVLSVDPQTGYPHLIYEVPDNDQVRRYIYKYYDGDSWKIMEGWYDLASNGLFFPKQLKFHPVTNEPYVLVHELNKTKLFYLKQGSWQQVGNDFYSGGLNTEFEFDPKSNQPIILQSTNIYTYNGITWDTKQTPLIDGITHFLHHPANNQLLISGGGHSDFLNQLIVYKQNGEEWELWANGKNEIKGSGGDRAYHQFLVNPFNKHLYMAYPDSSTNRLAVKEFFCTTFSEIDIEQCGSFTSPSGKYTYDETGTYLDIIPNVAGCDSIITIRYSNLNSYRHYELFVCDSMVSPSGKYTYYERGEYYDTIPNAAGCDSVIFIELYLGKTEYATHFAAACDSMISPSGKFIWHNSGTYTDTLRKSRGACDSIVTVNLTIHKPDTAYEKAYGCYHYQTPDGEYEYTSGIFTYNITSMFGCDSTVILDLIIQEDGNYNDTTIIKVSDKNFAERNQATYFDRTDNLVSMGDCDSAVHRYITYTYEPMVYTDTTLVTVQDTLKINVQFFTEVNSPQFAQMKVYPNPTRDILTIELEDYEKLDDYTLKIYNSTGTTVWETSLNDNIFQLNMQKFGNTGLYFLQIQNKNASYVITKKILLH